MPTTIHFVDVGQGNMVLIQAADGKNFMVDCNITIANEARIFKYVADQIGAGNQLHAFICTHRDADHMRGIEKLHARFPIRSIWDSDYAGTSTDTPEYAAYMNLRRRVGNVVKKRRIWEGFGRTRFRYLSAADERLEKNANAQGIVLKVEHRGVDGGQILGSAMLTGDCDAQTWRYGIMRDYSVGDVSSDILMAAHHGSLSFFDDPDDSKYYTKHIEAIRPAMSLISVGKNNHGHPDKNAVEFYTKHSTGSRQGNKVFQTDKKGTMKLTLKDDGGWQLSTER